MSRNIPPLRILMPALALCLGINLAFAGGEPFTPSHVAKLRSVTQVVISPDGSQVAYVLSVPRRPWEEEDGLAWAELHLVDTSGNSRPFVAGKVRVSAVAWTPDGREITFLAKRGDDEHLGVYSIPLGGGEARKIVSHDEKITEYSMSPGGEKIAFVAVEKLPDEVEKRKKKGFDHYIYEEEVRSAQVWIVDLEDEDAEPRNLELEGHASVLRWGADRSKLVVAVAPTPHVDDKYTSRKILVIDAGSGEVTGRVDNIGKLGYVEMSPDGERIAFLGGHDEWDPFAGRLMVASASGGAPIELMPGVDFDFRAFTWKDSSTISYIATERGVWTRVGEIGADGSGDRARVTSGHYNYTTITYSRNGSAAGFRADSPGYPGEVFLLKTVDTEPVRLTDSNPWLKEMQLGTQEVVTYQARDGQDLQGLLIHPLQRKEGERVPLVLVVHGGPESHFSNGWLTAYSRPGQLLAARGFAVFYPNYRGSTGRGIDFAKLSQGDPAGKEFDDLVDAVDHLIEQGLVDRNRVGITGGSYGGYASGWGATYYSERFAASVMFVGISNKISKVGETDIPNEEMYAHALQRVWDDWDKYLKRSPIYHAGKSRTPTLILHGDSDPRVHPSQSMELYRHLKLRSKAPVRLVFYKGEKHGNRRAASRYDYSVRMLRWMEHYLMGPGGAAPPYEVDYGFEDDEEEDEE